MCFNYYSLSYFLYAIYSLFFFFGLQFLKLLFVSHIVHDLKLQSRNTYITKSKSTLLTPSLRRRMNDFLGRLPGVVHAFTNTYVRCVWMCVHIHTYVYIVNIHVITLSMLLVPFNKRSWRLFQFSIINIYLILKMAN